MKSINLEDSQVVTILELIDEKIGIYNNSMTHDVIFMFDQEMRQQIQQQIDNLIKIKYILEIGK